MTAVSCRSVDNVVDFAIEKEEKAMDFYQKCADRAKNTGIKKFFLEMVAEETKPSEPAQGPGSLPLWPTSNWRRLKICASPTI